MSFVTLEFQGHVHIQTWPCRMQDLPSAPLVPGMTRSVSDVEIQHQLGLRVIAVYKAVKSAGLILVAIAAFRLHQERNFEHLVHMLEHLSLQDSSGMRWRLVGLLQQWGPNKFIAVGIVALAYAAIFATEGIGLWLRRHWAEWFTVIATGSLIPVEAYEMFHKFSWLKLGAFIGNVVIVIYLIRIAVQPHGRKP
jgi:uncharacterized membrane protein (DUF2068 family)